VLELQHILRLGCQDVLSKIDLLLLLGHECAERMVVLREEVVLHRHRRVEVKLGRRRCTNINVRTWPAQHIASSHIVVPRISFLQVANHTFCR
jgi:hypothetical protein